MSIKGIILDHIIKSANLFQRLLIGGPKTNVLEENNTPTGVKRSFSQKIVFSNLLQKIMFEPYLFKLCQKL